MTDAPAPTTTPSSPAPAAPAPSAVAPAATPPATPASTPSATPSTPTAASRPDWAPETAWNADKGLDAEAFGKHWTDKVAPVLVRDAAEQVRRNALPTKPEEVKIELPKEFQLPQGVEFTLDPAKPEFSKLQAAAVKHGLSQDAVTDLVGLYAETQVSSHATVAAAHAAEIAKLGANGPARVTALSTFFDGIGAGELKQMLVTEGIVRAAERMVAKFSSQGTAAFSQAGREPPTQQGKVSEAEFAKMSPAARLDYTRQFDQTQFQKSA